MITLMSPVYGEIDIPDWVTDLESFRKWYHSGTLPEKLKVHFINGRVWVDLFMEEYFSHNTVKTALGVTLGGLAAGENLGRYVSDGMLYRDAAADIGTEPDAMFVLKETFRAKRVSFVAGKRRGAQATELVGTPDIVIEIVSPSSEDKDGEWLMSAYHDAGIPEYWLIDARREKVRFDIYKRRPMGFTTTRAVDGWLKSAVLKREFRLVRFEDDIEMTDYRLEVR